jgi:putative oxidoreductase
MNGERILTHDRPVVDLSLLVLRLVGGVIFAAHGSQKLLGLFGGPGLAKTVENFGGGPLGYLVTIGEFFGGLGLIVGFLTRFSAGSLIVIMIGAIAMVHGKNGFFSENNGFEYNLALIGLMVPIFLCGPGRLSIGRLFLPKSPRSGRPYIAIE